MSPRRRFIKAYRALKRFRGDSAFYTMDLSGFAINTAKKSPGGPGSQTTAIRMLMHKMRNNIRSTRVSRIEAHQNMSCCEIEIETDHSLGHFRFTR